MEDPPGVADWYWRPQEPLAATQYVLKSGQVVAHLHLEDMQVMGGVKGSVFWRRGG